MAEAGAGGIAVAVREEAMAMTADSHGDARGDEAMSMLASRA
ncbi:MAG TPA: hypothetical protein VGS57_12220 [Thermoanaerobaculia bacterium]|jgi:hypothetical protein|nr:hypothetical protein [Thermoanaerobaculia bacterium]